MAKKTAVSDYLKIDIRERLEMLVGIRFSVETFGSFVKRIFSKAEPFIIIDTTHEKDECDTSDYTLMFNLTIREVSCDVTVFYLMLRKPDKDGNTFQVTEVTCEFN